MSRLIIYSPWSYFIVREYDYCTRIYNSYIGGISTVNCLIIYSPWSSFIVRVYNDCTGIYNCYILGESTKRFNAARLTSHV